jgi:hypothetical protein
MKKLRRPEYHSAGNPGTCFINVAGFGCAEFDAVHNTGKRPMNGKRNSPQPVTPGVARRTILIVEDEILCAWPRPSICDAGYQVLEATNAVEAVLLLMADHPSNWCSTFTCRAT